MSMIKSSNKLVSLIAQDFLLAVYTNSGKCNWKVKPRRVTRKWCSELT